MIFFLAFEMLAASRLGTWGISMLLLEMVMEEEDTSTAVRAKGPTSQ